MMTVSVNTDCDQINRRVLQSPGDCQNLVRRSKLAFKPSSRIAVHGVADHQNLMDTITFGARKDAEFMARWAGHHADQVRSDLTVLTSRALYGAKQRAGW
jgi:hypothetical protein